MQVSRRDGIDGHAWAMNTQIVGAGTGRRGARSTRSTAPQDSSSRAPTRLAQPTPPTTTTTPSLCLCLPLSLCLSVYLCLCLSVCLSVCLSRSLPLSVCLSVSASAPVSLSLCLSVSFSLSGSLSFSLSLLLFSLSLSLSLSTPPKCGASSLLRAARARGPQAREHEHEHDLASSRNTNGPGRLFSLCAFSFLYNKVVLLEQSGAPANLTVEFTAAHYQPGPPAPAPAPPAPAPSPPQACPAGFDAHVPGLWSNPLPCGHYPAPANCTAVDTANGTAALCGSKCTATKGCLAFEVYDPGLRGASCHTFVGQLAPPFTPVPACLTCVRAHTGRQTL